MLLSPVMYYSEYSKGLMKNPDIANFATKDFYLSPMGLVEPELFAEEELIELKKGEEKTIDGVSVQLLPRFILVLAGQFSSMILISEKYRWEARKFNQEITQSARS